MTGPLQLKYLDAMGIPVWVSRELVMEETLVDVNTDILPDQKVEKSAANSVNNILQDLETQTDQATDVESRHLQKSKAEHNNTNVLPQKPPQNDSANVLGQTLQYIIYASGSLEADWLVIGESPETINHPAGQPYADESGILLINMLRAVGIEDPRTQAYLINISKKPQKQIAQEQTSVLELNQLLHKTIDQIKPKILLIVGQLAAQNLLQSNEPLARLRGRSQKLAGTEIPVVVTYYPSYLLHKPLDKRKAWDDLKLAMALLA